MSVRIAVFASGGGSNLQALLDHFDGRSDATIRIVISDRADAGALDRARAAGVPAFHVATRERSDDDIARDTFDLLGGQDIELVALAGYLKLIPPAVTRQYRGRIVNIHPALLPAFGGRGMFGMHVHEAVLRARCRVSGATVHYVDEQYDEGAVIAQWPVPVLPGDTAATLAARVLQVEHRLYPVTLAALAAHLRGVQAGTSAQPAVFRLLPELAGVEMEMRALTEPGVT